MRLVVKPIITMKYYSPSIISIKGLLNILSTYQSQKHLVCYWRDVFYLGVMFFRPVVVTNSVWETASLMKKCNFFYKSFKRLKGSIHTLSIKTWILKFSFYKINILQLELKHSNFFFLLHFLIAKFNFALFAGRYAWFQPIFISLC